MNYLKRKWILFKNGIKLPFSARKIDILVLEENENIIRLLIHNKDNQPLSLKKDTIKPAYFRHDRGTIIGNGRIQNQKLYTNGFQIVVSKN
jgi:hypothetical protein